MAQSKRRPTHQTPEGVAVYPRLNKPDTKFNPEGVFSTKLRLSAADAQQVRRVIEEALPEAKALAEEAKKEAAKKGKKIAVKAADLPMQDVVDEDGNDTGEVTVSFKAGAKIKLRDGTVKDRTIPLFNAKGQPTKAEIWSGSRIVVAYSANPFFTAAVGYGVSLRLEAVQVIELVSGGQRDASGFGFKQREGYEGTGDENSTDTAKDGDEDAAGGGDDGDDGSADF